MKEMQKTFQKRLEIRIVELDLWEKLLKHYQENDGANRNRIDYVKNNIRELRAEIKTLVELVEDIKQKRGQRL